ncbi:MAG: class I SAM-dependent methyltransferase [Desulfobacca sp.]|uniref:class I SAM-dependent methyltransferase n=1 Tax=Desulfobacca sp. TaxID=2067990 RepID=UPI00404AD60D
MSIVPPPEVAVARAPLLDSLARRIIFGLLNHLRYGRLHLVEDGHRHRFGERCGQADLEATITIVDPRTYRRVLLAGSRGLGEAYVYGWWSTDNLTAVIRILTRNLPRLARILTPLTRTAAPLYRLRQFPRRNTLSGSRANIAAHYDLGNDFYALFLDETMTYSCGIFADAASALADASLAKYERICRKLALQPGDEVLEIGGGWGGFALYAASRYGCRVTTTTISAAQYEFARQRLAAAGLTAQVTLLRQDYRELSGSYDKLVSIEMIEAVGYEYLDTFFQVCSQRLKDDGLMCLQAITIQDQAFDRYRRSQDFIRRYIFPGGCLTSINSLGHSLARSSDLRIIHLEDITPHYVLTLRQWRQRFFANLERVRALGYSEHFIRLWDFYLSYCEGGFAEAYVHDIQLLLAKPRYRQPLSL